MSDIAYGHVRELPSLPFQQAVERVTAALKEQGFGVLADIDVQDTLARKIDVQTRPYRILGACNPRFAHAALQEEPMLGLLLPCNVVVAGDGDGGSVVSVIDPEKIFEVVENPRVAPVARQVGERLRLALDAL